MRLSGGDASRPLVSVWGWGWIAGLGLLFVYLHRHFLWRMYRIATGEWGGDWSHALIVPIISCYFISQNRHLLAAGKRCVYWPGLLVLFAGMFSFAWCIYPVRNDMLQGYSMIVSLFGLVLFLLGPGMMRVLWFPIVYLALGVKISDRLWEQIAWKLQLVAAKSSAFVMQLLWVDAAVEGSTITLTFQRAGRLVVEPINVAEACSGLRMLMAFVALGAAMAYLVERAWWKRLVMLVLAVPIAVLINIGRVTAIGMLSMVNPEMARGDFHVFVGMLMLVPAAALFILVGWVLDRAVIDEPRPETPPAALLEAGVSGFGPNGRRLWRSVVKGLVVGVTLTVVIGLEYGLLLASYRPEDLFAGQLSSSIAVGLLMGGLVLLAVGLWVVRKLVGTSGAGVSLGIGLGVLLAAVLGLNGVVQATRTVLVKQPVPVRRTLGLLPNRVGPWVKESEAPQMTAEALEALGTKQYISRVYRDTSKPRNSVGSRVRLHVAYYTGTPDTVPHVPDRCFVAGGHRQVGLGRATVRLSGTGYRQDDAGQWVASSKLDRDGVRMPATEMPVTLFSFADPNRPTQVANVVYFFVANGKVLPTPEWVRATAFDPRDRYSYYCKVEVGMGDLADSTAAAECASAFLSAMMPEIMACLPDWVDVTEGRWPAAGGSSGRPPAIR